MFLLKDQSLWQPFHQMETMSKYIQLFRLLAYL
jgi:hypothetical protein